MAWWGSGNQLDAGEDDEGPEEGFEEFLVNSFYDDGGETGGGDGKGHKENRDFDPTGIDDTQVDHEGYFEDVDDEEEPGRCADKSVLGECHGEEVELGNRAGSIGQHCRDAPEQAEEDAKGEAEVVGLFRVVDVFGLVALLPFAEEVEAGHDKEDPADSGLEKLPACLEVIKNNPSGEDPHYEEREEAGDIFPICMAAVYAYGGDVCGNQDGQEDTDGKCHAPLDTEVFIN